MQMSKMCEYGYFDRPLSWYDPLAGSTFFKFLKIQNISMSWHPGPKEAPKMITKAIIDPNRVVICDEGCSLLTFAAKIQKLIQELKELYNPSGTKGYSYLHNLYNSSLIHDLINLIIQPENSEDVRTRGQYALKSLEKIEGNLCSLNQQIFLFLSTSNDQSKEKIRKRLEKYSPIILQPQFSIKPHTLHRKTPQYKALISQAGQVLPIKQRALHDAFWEIEELLLGVEPTEECKLYYRNLQEIAAIEEFQLIGITSITWLRDPMLILNNKEILVPSHLNTGKINIWEMLSSDKKQPFGELICQLTSESEAYCTMGAVESLALFHSRIKGVKESPFYFEGGNLLAAINQKGEKIYLCGASNILFSFLNAHYLFSSKEKKHLLFKEIEKNKDHFSSEKLSCIQERLEKAGLLSLFPAEKEKAYLVKVTLAIINTIEKIISGTLGHPVCVIGDVFTTQPEFHLDMFLLPAPEGIIFMQDNALCCKVLETISKHYPLTQQEKKRLDSYLKNAEQKLKVHGDALKSIEEKLISFGFRVIPVPGLYYEKSKLAVVNFLNSIIAKGKKGTFCITNGSSHSLDRYLRDAYTDILRSHGIDHVYFVGRKAESEVWGRDPRNVFKAAAKSLSTGGGIHCRTQEINSLLRGFAITQDTTLSPLEGIQEQEYVGEAIQKFYFEMLQNQSFL